MKRFIEFLYEVEKDKYIHFICSLLISLFVFAICNLLKLGVYSAVPAITVPLIVGLCKELIDKKKTGNFDKADLATDFLGMFTGLIIIALLLIGK